jgi:hypothetical protein
MCVVARGGKQTITVVLIGAGGSFNPRSVYEGYLVDNTALGQVFLRAFEFSL